MDRVTRLDVIVTGGFHSQTVTDILQNEGVSYIVITPNVQGGVKEAEKTYYEIAKEQKEINFQTLATLIASLSTKTQQNLLQDLNLKPGSTKDDIKKALEQSPYIEKIAKKVVNAEKVESDDIDLQSVELIADVIAKEFGQDSEKLENYIVDIINNEEKATSFATVLSLFSKGKLSDNAKEAAKQIFLNPYLNKFIEGASEKVLSYKNGDLYKEGVSLKEYSEKQKQEEQKSFVDKYNFNEIFKKVKNVINVITNEQKREEAGLYIDDENYDEKFEKYLTNLAYSGDTEYKKFEEAFIGDIDKVIVTGNVKSNAAIELSGQTHDKSYYLPLKDSIEDSSNLEMIDTRLFDEDFIKAGETKEEAKKRADELLNFLNDDLADKIKNRTEADVRYKITLDDLKSKKIEDISSFYSLLGKETGENNSKVKELLEKSEGSLVIGNTLQAPWEYLIESAMKYEDSETRIKYLVGLQIDGILSVLLTIGNCLQNSQDRDMRSVLLFIHSCWSLNNPWDRLAHLLFPKDFKRNYDDCLSIEEIMKDGDYLKVMDTIYAVERTMYLFEETVNLLNLNNQEKEIVDGILKEWDKLKQEMQQVVEKEKNVVEDEDIEEIEEDILDKEISREYVLSIKEIEDRYNQIFYLDDLIEKETREELKKDFEKEKQKFYGYWKKVSDELNIRTPEEITKHVNYLDDLIKEATEEESKKNFEKEKQDYQKLIIDAVKKVDEQIEKEQEQEQKTEEETKAESAKLSLAQYFTNNEMINNYVMPIFEEGIFGIGALFALSLVNPLLAIPGFLFIRFVLFNGLHSIGEWKAGEFNSVIKQNFINRIFLSNDQRNKIYSELETKKALDKLREALNNENTTDEDVRNIASELLKVVYSENLNSWQKEMILEDLETLLRDMSDSYRDILKIMFYRSERDFEKQIENLLFYNIKSEQDSLGLFISKIKSPIGFISIPYAIPVVALSLGIFSPAIVPFAILAMMFHILNNVYSFEKLSFISKFFRKEKKEEVKNEEKQEKVEKIKSVQEQKEVIIDSSDYGKQDQKQLDNIKEKIDKSSSSDEDIKDIINDIEFIEEYTSQEELLKILNKKYGLQRIKMIAGNMGKVAWILATMDEEKKAEVNIEDVKRQINDEFEKLLRHEKYLDYLNYLEIEKNDILESNDVGTISEFLKQIEKINEILNDSKYARTIEIIPSSTISFIDKDSDIQSDEYVLYYEKGMRPQYIRFGKQKSKLKQVVENLQLKNVRSVEGSQSIYYENFSDEFVSNEIYKQLRENKDYKNVKLENGIISYTDKEGKNRQIYIGKELQKYILTEEQVKEVIEEVQKIEGYYDIDMDSRSKLYNEIGVVIREDMKEEGKINKDDIIENAKVWIKRDLLSEEQQKQQSFPFLMKEYERGEVTDGIILKEAIKEAPELVVASIANRISSFIFGSKNKEINKIINKLRMGTANTEDAISELVNLSNEDTREDIKYILIQYSNDLSKAEEHIQNLFNVGILGRYFLNSHKQYTEKDIPGVMRNRLVMRENFLEISKATFSAAVITSLAWLPFFVMAISNPLFSTGSPMSMVTAVLSVVAPIIITFGVNIGSHFNLNKSVSKIYDFTELKPYLAKSISFDKMAIELSNFVAEIFNDEIDEDTLVYVTTTSDEMELAKNDENNAEKALIIDMSKVNIINGEIKGENKQIRKGKLTNDGKTRILTSKKGNVITVEAVYTKGMTTENSVEDLVSFVTENTPGTNPLVNLIGTTNQADVARKRRESTVYSQQEGMGLTYVPQKGQKSETLINDIRNNGKDADTVEISFEDLTKLTNSQLAEIKNMGLGIKLNITSEEIENNDVIKFFADGIINGLNVVYKTSEKAEKGITKLNEIAKQSGFANTTFSLQVEGEISNDLVEKADNNNIVLRLTKGQIENVKVKNTLKSKNMKVDLMTTGEDINNIDNLEFVANFVTAEPNNLLSALGKIIGDKFKTWKGAIKSLAKEIEVKIKMTPAQKFEKGKNDVLKRINASEFNEIKGDKFFTEGSKLNKDLSELLVKDDVENITKDDIQSIINSGVFVDDVNADLQDLLEKDKVYEAYGALRGFAQLAMQEIAVNKYLVRNTDNKNEIIEKLSGEYSDLRDYLTIEMIKLSMQGEDLNKLFEIEGNFEMTVEQLESLVKKNMDEILKQNRYKIDTSTRATLEDTRNILDALDSQLPKARVGSKSVEVMAISATRSMLAAA
ncbi:hypothetical protein [Candidatus Ruminimicrobium bovinum]|uniref:hypothetical protein n=1 Tax=Candidatus Ruminimicrobium bovinum TaxID=3242779 RepID=UPI0039B99DE0